MIIAELIDGCQLKCTLCWNRDRVGSFKQMKLTTVEKILNKYRGGRIDWFNWGEPLLHKEFLTIAEMVRRTRSCVSTNFSLKLSDEYFNAMQHFQQVLVSMSGLTPEVYNLYHRGGNFDLVMENIKKLADKKRARLKIRWLSHKDNEHQTEEAGKYFYGLGYDVEVVPLNCEIENCIEGIVHPYLRPKHNRSRHFRCGIIGRHTIDVDGNHLLCCATHNVPIGISIYDDISDEDLIKVKMNTELCLACQKGEHWRMFK